MPFYETELRGVFIFEPRVYDDERGFFYESYNQGDFNKYGISNNFVQDNHSYSKYGVLRGLHYQLEPYAQAKLVRVVHGKIFDVAVDIRPGSPELGKWAGVELSSENKKQVFIPAGFAHGFLVLSEYAEVIYKCDNFYHSEKSMGIMYNDPEIAVKWPEVKGGYILSEKDKTNPSFGEPASGKIRR